MNSQMYELLMANTTRRQLNEAIERVAASGKPLSAKAVLIEHVESNLSAHVWLQCLMDSTHDDAQTWLDRYADEARVTPPGGYMYENTGNYLPGATMFFRFGDHAWSEDCWYLDA